MAATATRTFEVPLDHLDASLEDFEHSTGGEEEEEEDLPSEMAEDDVSDSEASAGGYSPPAWKRLGNGDRSSGFWRRSSDDDQLTLALGAGGGAGGFGPFGGQLQQPAYDSRESSPEYESADEGDLILAQAIRTRLPPDSMSPDKEPSPAPEEYHVARQYLADADGEDVKVKVEDGGKGGALTTLGRFGDRSDVVGQQDANAGNNNCKCHLFSLFYFSILEWPRERGPSLASNLIKNFRFALRAEVLQRTEPIEAAINLVRTSFGVIFGSRASVMISALVAFISYGAMRSLFQPPAMRPVPDLVKVAGVARSFEPLIYYSERGIQQVGEIQATGVAVWDLSESVRSSNMTSAPIMVKELDELSDSLKTLAVELIKFFSSVNGDIDSILIVMDWARRELYQLQQQPSLPLSSAFDNIHNMLSNAGILENPTTGQATAIGVVASSIFGPSTPQRTKQTLQRTFREFLSVLEEAITNELQHSLTLLALYESIDHQFLNLARTVVRESSLQDELHDELLSSLWTRILGPRAADVNKYDRNRQLLLGVRKNTVLNKEIMIAHNHKLMILKANLETLRRKLVSPLVRSVNSSTISLDEQIRGLEDVGEYLESVRTRQKGKLMEMLYGGSRGNVGLSGSPAAAAAAAAEGSAYYD
ncbi:hypothetical protein B0T26DRAFT_408153 [Lasiosphaeria miniovina]|uniref:Uncharacterized protein n=1 Tax=Lasiosphaeria miniovina TaxID=1954250 RepID=A0AA40A5F2_9PEZI|nr:uncharacterized protein B0T26DRAFT_408153 [Lasiosphaeria miniovina]KAK0709501.1 hypothetical protein B0T26DRAFT_408153 [Lasiosphaeria miniovina]